MVFGRSTLANRFLDFASTCSRKRCGKAIGRNSILRRIVPEFGGRGLQIQAVVSKELKWGFNGGEVFRVPPLLPRRSVVVEEEERWRNGAISIEGLRKAIMASQMEMVKSRLREIPKSSVILSEFFRICCESSTAEQGPEIARLLDKSGTVIFHGKVVFLHPNQVTKAIQRVIPLSLAPRDDPRRKELRELERKKAMIDKEAEDKVRRELWSGLGFFAVQTSAFMRLTFWELSWDVMEPICFYVTSIYFMAGYVFFMKTSADPSFEVFFKSRFATKQKQLMKTHRFNLSRFNELRGASSGHLISPTFLSSEDKLCSSSCEL